jgi:hypothetical protein
VAALLLPEALLQGLQELVPAHGLDLPLLFLRQEFLGELAQPLLRDLGLLQCISQRLQTLEHVTEDPVEPVEVALVLHQAGAGKVVELLNPLLREVLVEGVEEGQVFAQSDGHLGGAELGEEGQEHG